MPGERILIVGAGAAGLIAGRELARAGRRVTILEARDRPGGRIAPLDAATFGYAAEGGAEFVHGEAPVTRALAAEAGLALTPLTGRGRTMRDGKIAGERPEPASEERLQQALAALETDMPIAEFLESRFADPQFAALRRAITRMAEGYDAADPRRASTFALRDEWMGEGLDQQDRVAEGYGALIAYLASECRRHGAAIHLESPAMAIEANGGELLARTDGGGAFACDQIVLTVPLPLLAGIALPTEAGARRAAAADIGFGNVVKILLRFRERFWSRHGGQDLSDLSFLFSEAKVPTWWTQYPRDHAVLTGWFAGPKADTVAHLSTDELVEMGLASLAEIFALPVDKLRGGLLGAVALDWGRDPWARGAYSYATPATRAAQALLRAPGGDGVHFSGEALYPGRDMGTVEAALAAGRDTAAAILARS